MYVINGSNGSTILREVHFLIFSNFDLRIQDAKSQKKKL